MAWYAQGTVAVTSASGDVVGTGTGWVTNNGAIAGQGINIYDAAGLVHSHEITAVSGDGAMTISPNYTGTTAGSLSYKIVPVQGAMVDVAAALTALIESSGSIAGLAPADGDIIQYLGTAYATRSALQYFTALTANLAQVDVPSAATCDIGAALSPKVRITGSVTITSLGGSENCLRIVLFAAAVTLTHHATSLILPGNANIVTAAGDQAIFVSDASDNWRCINYQRQATAP